MGPEVCRASKSGLAAEAQRKVRVLFYRFRFYKLHFINSICAELVLIIILAN